MPRKSANGASDGGELQQFQVALTCVGNQWVSKEFSLPLLNLPNKSPNEFLAVEIHEVEVFRLDNTTHPAIWALTSNNLQGTTLANAPIATVAIDPRTVISGATGPDFHFTFDLTDDRDRGKLYPNQKLYITMNAHANTPVWAVRFWYKVVHVSKTTYLEMMNNYYLLA